MTLGGTWRRPGAVAVLAHPADAGARRLVGALAARGRVEARLVTDIELGLAVWHNRPSLLDGDGDDGAAVVHCRLRGVTPLGFNRAPPAEQAYAASELFALTLSWLQSLGPRAVNRPSPLGLAGRERSAFEWLALAADTDVPVADAVVASSGTRVAPGAGTRRILPPAHEPLGSTLPTLPSPDPVPAGRRPALFLDGPEPRSVLVVGSTVCDGPTNLRNLAQAAGCDVLEVFVRPDAAVVGATPIPSLASDAHVAALADLLEERARS